MQIALPMCESSPWAREVAIRMAELGHDIYLIDFITNSKEREIYWPRIDWPCNLDDLSGKIQILYFKLSIKHKSRYIAFAIALRRLFHAKQIQIVLVLNAGGYAIMTYLSGFRPYVVYTTGSDVLMVDCLRKWVNRRVLRKASGIIANGKYLAEKTSELCGRKDVIPLYMGLDTKKFVPRINNTAKVQILASRGFLPIYNNEYLIRALALLPESLPLDSVVFPSSGPDLPRIKCLANNILPSYIKEKVHFCGGVTDIEMMQYLLDSCIYVSLSKSDGTSISTLEALACGLFPVLSDIPQNREWIDCSRENGILVSFDQPHVLAECLRRVILDGSLRKAASYYNRSLILKRANSRLNMAWLSEKLGEIYEYHHIQS